MSSTGYGFTFSSEKIWSEKRISGRIDNQEEKLNPRREGGDLFISPQETGNILIGFFDQTFWYNRIPQYFINREE